MTLVLIACAVGLLVASLVARQIALEEGVTGSVVTRTLGATLVGLFVGGVVAAGVMVVLLAIGALL